MRQTTTIDEEVLKSVIKKNPNKNDTRIAEIYSDLKGIKYSDKIRRNVSRLITKIKSRVAYKSPEKSPSYTAAIVKDLQPSSTYFVTWAQANTPIDRNLWKNMKAYADHTNAEIIVLPGTYSISDSQYEKLPEVWAKEINPYLFAREEKLHKYLSIISDAHVLPTAERPLRGFEGVTGEDSSIVGHPRQHIESVATLPNSTDKFLMTTGAITVPNYRKARVGKKAKFNHVMGFLVIEIIDEDNFIPRHVSTTPDGNFIDLMFLVENGKVTRELDVEAFAMEVHLQLEDKEVLKSVYEFSKYLSPKRLVLHDLFNGTSVNPHIKSDFIEKVVRSEDGQDCVLSEINYMLDFLEDWKTVGEIHVIPSNHNDWLDRWVRNGSGSTDVKNIRIFNELQNILIDKKAEKGLIAWAIDDEFEGDGVITYGRNDSFKICGIEMNNHGDLGASGAKGTPETFRKLNTKIVSGDKHFLYTLDGACGIGIVAKKDHGYNKGLGKWVQSIGLVNRHGKFQHAIYKNGVFTNFQKYA